jgi:hypothetical protein
VRAHQRVGNEAQLEALDDLSEPFQEHAPVIVAEEESSSVARVRRDVYRPSKEDRGRRGTRGSYARRRGPTEPAKEFLQTRHKDLLTEPGV